MKQSDDDFIKGAVQCGILAIVLILVLLAFAHAKELPVLVSVADLAENSVSYDTSRVTIVAYTRSCKAMRGRMGANYLKCRVGKGDHEISVYTDFPLYGLLNKKVIVQGTYYRKGWFGGHLANHFIHAETVIRDWDGDR